jgi:hypothetical protein
MYHLHAFISMIHFNIIFEFIVMFPMWSPLSQNNLFQVCGSVSSVAYDLQFVIYKIFHIGHVTEIAE